MLPFLRKEGTWGIFRLTQHENGDMYLSISFWTYQETLECVSKILLTERMEIQHW